MPPAATPAAATPLEGVFPYPSSSAPSISLALAMAGREAIAQLLGLCSQGNLYGAGHTEGARAKGQG
jgi:hypothetical protein